MGGTFATTRSQIALQRTSPWSSPLVAATFQMKCAICSVHCCSVILRNGLSLRKPLSPRASRTQAFGVGQVVISAELGVAAAFEGTRPLLRRVVTALAASARI